ncbi:protein phosphatase 2C domain-containing protein [Synechococcus lacustris C3-12m-Tous]|nr:protein phosphatase 2C domain-containing protein [Synechococcus lacustris C3-12m-Tous]
MCQDASGWCSLKDRSGHPVHLMVVADGHGGKRYIHSDVGSRLACELSLNLVAEQLGQRGSVGRDAVQRWQEWLEDAFPKALHQRWKSAVETHWYKKSTKRETSEASYSPISYGTTIALVMMTPTWWAHTGLGDWDLVRIGSNGEVKLVNEEQEEEQNGGESTYSLCLNNAPRHFAPRTAVHLITEQEPAFSLLLSTDGVRKSCSTDADFFAIASYLCEEKKQPQANSTIQLNADLDRISSQGSGDDVSIAIGRWALLEKRLLLKGGPGRKNLSKTSEWQVVQPGKEEGVQDRLISPSGQKLPSLANVVESDPDISVETNTPRSQIWSSPLVIGLVVITVAVAGMAFLSKAPFIRSNSGDSGQPSLEVAEVLLKQKIVLCKLASTTVQNPGSLANNKTNQGGNKSESENLKNQLTPGKQDAQNLQENALPSDTSSNDGSSENPSSLLLKQITETLNHRKSTFRDLENRSKSPDSYLAAPSTDPLGALIAWSYTDPKLKPLRINSVKGEGFLNKIVSIIPHWLRPVSNNTSNELVVKFCPELREAITRQWQRERSEAAAVHSFVKPAKQKRSDGQTPND